MQRVTILLGTFFWVIAPLFIGTSNSFAGSTNDGSGNWTVSGADGHQVIATGGATVTVQSGTSMDTAGTAIQTNSVGYTITNNGDITATAGSDEGNGIKAAAANTTVINHGSITSADDSIEGDNGNINTNTYHIFTNSSTGVIDAGDDGFDVSDTSWNQVTNEGTIYASKDGIQAEGGADNNQYTNTGTIGTEARPIGDDGVDFQYGDNNTFLNTSTGSINANHDGVDADDTDGTVITNQGTITAGTGSTNWDFNGISVENSTNVTITNSGTIDSSARPEDKDGEGIDIQYVTGTSKITNTSTGIINASSDGIDAADSDNLVIDNQGTILSNADGIWIVRSTNASITNSGSITGGATGISFSASTLTNSGIITGSGGTAIQDNGGTSTINLQTGSNIQGSITDSDTTDADTLNLDGAGTLASDVDNFENMNKAGTGEWILNGNHTGGSLVNLQAGTLTVNGSLDATPGFILQSDTTLRGSGTISGSINGNGSDNTSIDFQGTLDAIYWGFSGSNNTISNQGTIGAQGNDGISFNDDGANNTITNHGTIDGQNGDGISFSEDAINNTINNYGLIRGRAGDGIQIGEDEVGGETNDNTINNLGGGRIIGSNNGILLEEDDILARNTINNGASSLIQGGSHGIYLYTDDEEIPDTTITNEAGATIIGGNHGIYINADWSSVDNTNITNAGTITATTGDGIRIFPDDSSTGNNLTNGTSGSISGAVNGVYISNSNSGTIDNAGSISGTTGIGLFAGQQYTITNSGSITGDSSGLSLGTGSDITNSGTVSGTTGIQLSASTLTNSGTITGSGGTAINDTGSTSTITLQSGSDIQGNIDDSSATDADVLNLDGSGTLTSDISNVESINKTGGGSWILNGNTTGGSLLDIQAGSLMVNGTIDATTGFTIQTGATLGGTGTITGKVTNHGAISAGNSIGTLTIDGDYTHNGGDFDVEVNGTQADKVVVSGDVIINGGTVKVTTTGVIPNEAVYDILTAGNSLTGTFTTVDSVLNNFGLNYDTLNTVQLEITRIPYNQVEGLNPSQTRLATHLENNITRAALVDVHTSLNNNGSTSATLKKALNDISPDANSIFKFLSHRQSRKFRSGFRKRSRGWRRSQLEIKPPVMLADAGISMSDAGSSVMGREIYQSIWTTLIGTNGTQESNEDHIGYDFQTYGIAAGYDTPLRDDLLVGVSLGLNRSSVDFSSDPLSSADSQAVNIALYASYLFKHAYIDGSGSYSVNTYDADRYVAPASLIAMNDHDGTEFSFSLETGYEGQIEKLLVTSFAAFQYAHLNEDGYTETGAGAFNLAIADAETDSYVSRVGLRFDAQNLEVSKTGIAPEFTVAWAHEFGDVQQVQNSRFVSSTGSNFRWEGVEIERDSLLINATLNVDLKENMKLSLSLDQEYRSDFNASSLQLGYRYLF